MNPVPPIELKYHDQAFRLLDRTPAISAEAVRLIAEYESNYQTRFPAALREWYSMEGVEEALAEHTGACGPTSLGYVLERFATSNPGPHFLVDQRPGVTLFTEWSANTGWEANLLPDGSDDPPVEADADPPRTPFSSYVLSMAWWRVTFNDQPGKSYRGKGSDPAIFGPPHLDFLNEHFEELPRSPAPWFRSVLAPKPPEPMTFRFFRPGWFLEVNSDGNPATGFRRAEYCLTATNKEQLQALDEFTWPCRDRGTA